jgi:hypothetical protein
VREQQSPADYPNSIVGETAEGGSGEETDGWASREMRHDLPALRVTQVTSPPSPPWAITASLHPRPDFFRTDTHPALLAWVFLGGVSGRWPVSGQECINGCRSLRGERISDQVFNRGGRRHKLRRTLLSLGARRLTWSRWCGSAYFHPMREIL